MCLTCMHITIRIGNEVAEQKSNAKIDPDFLDAFPRKYYFANKHVCVDSIFADKIANRRIKTY